MSYNLIRLCSKRMLVHFEATSAVSRPFREEPALPRRYRRNSSAETPNSMGLRRLANRRGAFKIRLLEPFRAFGGSRRIRRSPPNGPDGLMASFTPQAREAGLLVELSWCQEAFGTLGQCLKLRSTGVQLEAWLRFQFNLVLGLSQARGGAVAF